jgi:predicted component of viral defense system (DUF524 family)
MLTPLPEEKNLNNDHRQPNSLVDSEVLMTIEDVQRALNRSRATIYRYANTDPKGRHFNMPYDPQYLNPEHRTSPRDPLRFHPTEVARFAKDVLQIRDVRVEILAPRSETYALLQAILEELKAIRRSLPHPGSD